MNKLFFQYRSKWIKDCRKLSKPYLVIGHGRLRFSNDWMVYEKCALDFNRSLVEHRHSNVHLRLAMVHGKERRNTRHDEHVIDRLFGDSPLAKLIQGFRFRQPASQSESA